MSSDGVENTNALACCDGYFIFKKLERGQGSISIKGSSCRTQRGVDELNKVILHSNTV